jgi:hypothetical protein
MAKPLLPTRVIDVGTDDGTEPRLWASGGHIAEYVTLSHCWGEVRPLTTEKSMLSQCLLYIPISSMPKTFQGAVAVTRGLGYRFLLINSLCIIQDSVEDWEQECSKMAGVYRNATVTICGSTMADSSAGFLHTREPPKHTPYLWEYRDGTAVPRRATLRLFYHKYGSLDYPEEPQLTHTERPSPLDKRGWVLQEYLLSPRMLFFGRYRMYWECTKGVKYEDFPHLVESI